MCDWFFERDIEKRVISLSRSKLKMASPGREIPKTWEYIRQIGTMRKIPKMDFLSRVVAEKQSWALAVFFLFFSIMKNNIFCRFYQVKLTGGRRFK